MQETTNTHAPVQDHGGHLALGETPHDVLSSAVPMATHGASSAAEKENKNSSTGPPKPTSAQPRRRTAQYVFWRGRPGQVGTDLDAVPPETTTPAVTAQVSGMAQELDALYAKIDAQQRVFEAMQSRQGDDAERIAALEREVAIWRARAVDAREQLTAAEERVGQLAEELDEQIQQTAIAQRQRDEAVEHTQRQAEALQALTEHANQSFDQGKQHGLQLVMGGLVATGVGASGKRGGGRPTDSAASSARGVRPLMSGALAAGVRELV
ncbi:hypothetical protein NFJ02_31g81030 [Pycnococcus provasolii]